MISLFPLLFLYCVVSITTKTTQTHLSVNHTHTTASLYGGHAQNAQEMAFTVNLFVKNKILYFNKNKFINEKI